MKPALKRTIWVFVIVVIATIAAAVFVTKRISQSLHADPCPAPQKQIAETGMEAINKDALSIFDKYGATNNEAFYSELQQLESFPALKDLTRRLGSYSLVILEPRHGGEPEHLKIRCGNHFNCHFIYVFDPRISIETQSSMFKDLLPLTNNIFLRM
jgi:phosphopentomutase